MPDVDTDSMTIPTLIIHGWSDTSASFRPVARFLAQNGHDVREIFLGDYKSLHDEITLEDLGQAMRNALENHEIPLARHSFNVVIHSTGGLVVREFLRQFCRDGEGEPDASITPIRNVLMLAPANFGSSLAKVGKSMVGRLFKGWKWDGPFETGKRLLDALELGSPISFELAESDLFDPDFPIFDPEHTRVTVMMGSGDSDSRLVRINQENGSDGVVRVSTASLNAHFARIDFADPAHPKLVRVARSAPQLALAIFDRSHGNITKDISRQQEDWRRVALGALSVDAAGYAEHVADCERVSSETIETGQQARRIRKRKRFHEYMHVVFRVHDQYGDPIDDYFIEFYQEKGDDSDRVMEKVHTEILEKVKTNSIDPSHRSFLFDLTDLKQAMTADPSMKIDMSIVAADLSEDVGYRNPPNVETSGIRVFDAETRDFFLPHCPLLIDITLYRDAGPKVFRIKPA